MEITANRLNFGAEIWSGASAGLAVDLTLFPLDTVKTRLQSAPGLWASGGFTRLYAGIPSVMVGSAPGAALFFATYEGFKTFLTPLTPHPAMAHMLAASVGEVVACLVRVPTEVCKQRAQAFPKRGVRFVLAHIFKHEGPLGLYRGYRSTVMREIPFSLIQFPMWEAFKKTLAQRTGHQPTPLECACCGSVAGTISAVLTTPLDVAKTRIMLADRLHGHSEGKIFPVLRDVWSVHGVRGLWSGVGPRGLWMGIGGFVFFGAYSFTRRFYGSFLTSTPDDQYLDTTSLKYYTHRSLIEKLMDLLRTGTLEEKTPKTFDEAMQETQREMEMRKDFIRRKEIALRKKREEIGG